MPVTPRSPADSAPLVTRLRRGLRLIAINALLLGVGVVATFLIFVHVQAGRSRAHWHADVMLQWLDCSRGGVCRKIPGPIHNRDASGKTTTTETINSLGYRGKERSITRARPETLRIAMFGDSMMYGTGVDDDSTLPASLERALAEALPGREVEVMNFGMPMNYPTSYMPIYQEFGRQFRPDMVILQFDGNVNPKDMNYRIAELRGSPLASTLMKLEAGRSLINDYQVATMDWYVRSTAEADLRSEIAALLADKKEWGLEVWFWSFWDKAEGLDRIVPPGLAYTSILSGTDFEEYRERWAIPGDGHPTALGHHHFAEVIARKVLPTLLD